MSEKGNSLNDALMNGLRTTEETSPRDQTTMNTQEKIPKRTFKQPNTSRSTQQSMLSGFEAAMQSSGSSDALSMPGHRPREKGLSKSRERKYPIEEKNKLFFYR